jgi:hypothetical protein
MLILKDSAYLEAPDSARQSQITGDNTTYVADCQQESNVFLWID